MADYIQDFRDPAFDAERKRLAATRAPSQAATDLATQTRSAIQSVSNPAVRMPTNTSVPNRQGPRIAFATPDGRNPEGAVNASKSQADNLFEQARNAKNLADRSSYMRQALAQSDYATAELRGANDLSIAGDRNTSAGDIAELGARTDLSIAGQRESTARDLGTLDALTNLSSDQTRAQAMLEQGFQDNLTRRYIAAEDNATREGIAGTDNTTRLAVAKLQQSPETFSFNDVADVVSRGFVTGEALRPFVEAAIPNARSPAELEALRSFLTGGAPVVQQAAGGQVPSFAEGGMVMPQPGGGANPALGAASPQMPDMEALSAYQRYAKGAQAMGLSVVGFDQFTTMRQQAQPVGAVASQASGAGAPVAMAEGGQVPGADASGKMVIDPDPNAPTDSIPAIIDGKTPAALDSGEVVFPRHAVLYYGTDKLNKMIAKAKEAAEGGNGESATGLGGRAS